MGYIDKKHVLKKLHDFHRQVQKNGGKIGKAPRIIDLSYDNVCNFKCQHCFTRAPEGINTKEHMTEAMIRQLADEADELGFYEFDLQGGELLIRPEMLFQLIDWVGAERFYLYLTTNGYFLSEEMAHRLAKAGIDRVSVSIDSLNAKEHDDFRGQKGAFDRAIQALKYVKAEGMEPFMNITVGHYNAFSPELEEQLAFSYDNGFQTILNAAVPAGCWKGNYEVMLTQEDTAHILELRKKYPNMVRDLWDPFDRKKESVLGCNAGNLLYITPWGDVLPCPFLHIKLGNLYENTLKDIFKYVTTVEQLMDYSDKCLAGEAQEFMKKYLSGDVSTQHPADAHILF
ncbi:MAG: radical SAM protein [Lachnoclostridium sp.]|nr:radical SAM protein [Lachnospira sp.]MCM1247300.1 radical SAM protein [Lachnoclostridium sp.]MCM1534398.1 radical SAM protein [Clostridium sp.]